MTLPNDIARCAGVGSDEEGWRDIPGYEGWYQASPNGEIRSVDRTIISNNQFTAFELKRIGKPLSKTTTHDGYERVCMHYFSKKETRLVHHLVALTFIGERPAGLQINHIDGNKKNNQVKNLEYVSCKENVEHARKVLKVGIQYGERNGRSKLSDRDVRRIKYDNRLQRVIAEEYGITQAHVSRIKRLVSWGRTKNAA